MGNSIGVVVMNPYQPPRTLPDSLNNDEPVSLCPARIRVATGVAVTLIPLVIFGTHPAMAISYPKTAFLTAVATAVILGLMPAGYGKSDGSMGLWILFVTVCFSLLVWQQASMKIHPQDRAAVFVLCVVVFGFGLGILLIGIYAVARRMAQRASTILCQQTHKATDSL